MSGGQAKRNDIGTIPPDKFVRTRTPIFPKKTAMYSSMTGDGVEEKITAVETQGKYVRFDISCRYQERKGSYRVEVRQDDTDLVATVTNYQKLLE